WLVVSRRQIAVLTDGEPAQSVCAISVEQVEAFRACAGVGSGLLQARIDGAWVDLLRYSNTLAHRFTKVAAKLEVLREEGQLVVQPGDEVDERRCPACGFALGFVGDICPRCINRGAVLGRVWEMMRPYRRPAAGRRPPEPRRPRHRGAVRLHPPVHERVPAANSPGGRRRRDAVHAQREAGVVDAGSDAARLLRELVLLALRLPQVLPLLGR